MKDLLSTTKTELESLGFKFSTKPRFDGDITPIAKRGNIELTVSIRNETDKELAIFTEVYKKSKSYGFRTTKEFIVFNITEKNLSQALKQIIQFWKRNGTKITKEETK